jgi:type IX secretion system PorP/SprF family membrane protein
MMKVMRIGLVLVVLFLFLGEMKGQQIGLYSHYFYNSSLYNPAFTGNKEHTNLMLISRSQWTGFKGSPRLNLVSVDGSFMDKKMGLGAILYSDTKGMNKTIGGKLAYSYKLKLNEDSRLNFGVSVQFVSHRIDLSQAVVQDVSEPLLFTSEKSKTNFDGNLGIVYFWKRLEIASSLNQVVKNKYSFFDENTKPVSYQPSFHYFNSIKYTFQPNPEKQYLIVPQLLIQNVSGSPFSFELNTNFYVGNKFWIGAAYKNNYAVSANVGATFFNQLSFGYSYDVIVSEIGQYSGISHELMLNYQFIKGEKKEKKEKEPKEDKPIKKETKEKSVVEKKIEEKVTPQPKEDDLAKVTEEKPKKPIEDKPKTNQTTDVIILDATVDDFAGPNGKQAKKGVYVIVGSFKENDLAKKYNKTILERGYPQSNWFYSKTRDYNYVYMFVESGLEGALKKIDEARAKGSKAAWIIVLTE